MEELGKGANTFYTALDLNRGVVLRNLLELGLEILDQALKKIRTLPYLHLLNLQQILHRERGKKEKE